MGAHNLNFVPNFFFKNMFFSAPNFAFLDGNFRTEKDFQRAENLGEYFARQAMVLFSFPQSRHLCSKTHFLAWTLNVLNCALFLSRSGSSHNTA